MQYTHLSNLYVHMYTTKQTNKQTSITYTPAHTNQHAPANIYRHPVIFTSLRELE